MKKKMMMVGCLLVASLAMGCASTECRDSDRCDTAKACGDKGECCGTCGGDEKAECCGTCGGAEKAECCGTCGGDSHAHGDDHSHD